MAEVTQPVCSPEPFVDQTRAAAFLGLAPRRILELARAGILPGYPLGQGGRKIWRFRLTELAVVLARLAPTPHSFGYANQEPSYRSKPAKCSAGGR